MSEPAETTLKKTPLYDLHERLGGRMVGFAGYSMPVQYPDGIVTEHNHTRAKAGLFDVSHMGQVWLKGNDHAHVSKGLEKLVPGDISALEPGRIRYTQFTNSDGGILDDLMVTRLASEEDDGTLYFPTSAGRNMSVKPTNISGAAAGASASGRGTRYSRGWPASRRNCRCR